MNPIGTSLLALLFPVLAATSILCPQERSTAQQSTNADARLSELLDEALQREIAAHRSKTYRVIRR
ncbi:hypothetical protein, partial [Salmonella sp. SAL4447]|uniref:hypothetical protein n=1 Tax=Salmonella sp. SAL4447 TaxID=3159902 RepID=UPI00397B788A